MKYLILFLVSFNLYAQTARVGMINKAVASSGTPEALTTSDLLVRKFRMAAASDNTGLIFIGTSAATATAANGITLVRGTAAVPGTVLEFGGLENNSGPKINLKDIYVGVATNGDQVNVLYVE